jgi:hypothetical protein
MATAARANERRPAWRTLAALAGLFVFGLGLRLFRLGTVPLGGHGDVSWIGLNALDWLHNGIWPYYVYELYAPEPVIVYLAGLSISIFGPGFFASRLPTALASALVVPVGFLAARWLGGEDSGEEPLTLRTMWLFVLAYAVSFYPIMLGKSGQRSQLFPLEVMALTLLFATAWGSGKRWAFAAAALTLAVANYTYIPARLLPIVLALWAAHQWIVDRSRFRQRIGLFAAMLALSALLVMPQLITYLRTPEAFFARSSQSAGQLIFQTGLRGGALWATLGRKALGEAAIFLLPWHGAYAEMGRPLLALPLGIGALTGLAAAFFRPRDKALWWPLIGIPLMVLTDILSGTQPEPHGLRMIGVLPFAFLLAARGLALLWGWIEGRVKADGRRTANMAAALALGALIAGPGLYDFWDYHWRYIPAQQADPATADTLEASDVFLAELILAHAGDGPPILITLDDFTRANIPYLLSAAYPTRRSGIAAGGALDTPAWGDEALVALPADPYRPRHDGKTPEHDGRGWVLLAEGEQILLPPLEASEAAALQAELDSAEPLDAATDWIGQPAAALYAVSLSPEAFTPQVVPVGASLGGEVALAGYQVESQTLSPGEPLWITLYWEAEAVAAEDYETFVQVLDASGGAVAQVHRWTLDGVYRTRLWTADEWVPTRFRLDIPPDLPPGPYTVIAGLYRVLANEPVGVVDEAENVVAPHVTLSGFKVALPPATISQPPPEQPITFGGTIALAGIDATVDGDQLVLRADWQATARPAADHTLFVHVVDEAGEIAAQLDTQPRGGAYPTGIWDAGEVVPDEYTIPLDGLPGGAYRVYLGWYTLPSGERLEAMVGGDPVPDNRVEVYHFAR